MISAPLWLVAATLGGIAITLVGMNRAAIVAWFQRSEEIRPDDRRLNESARARAEQLRDEADERCALKLWGACEVRLDEAMKLDPGGESKERVRHMRDIMDSAARAEAGPDKPHTSRRVRGSARRGSWASAVRRKDPGMTGHDFSGRVGTDWHIRKCSNRCFFGSTMRARFMLLVP